MDIQIHLPDYQFPPFRRDRNSSGGKIIYIRNVITAKRLTVHETQNTESICVEITIKGTLVQIWKIRYMLGFI